MTWESSIDKRKLPCVKQLASGKLLHHAGSLAGCSEMTSGVGWGERGRLQREGVYIYIQLIHFVVRQKLAQRCQASIADKAHAFMETIFQWEVGNT